jgi:hypothetical protein
MDERLAQLLDDAVPQPPREIDPKSLRTEAVRGPRRGLLAPVLAAAAIVAVAVTIAALVGRDAPAHTPSGRSAPARPAGRTSQPPSSIDAGENERQHAADLVARDVTAEVVPRLLAAAPVVPGATRVAHAPVKALRQPMETPASPNLVRRTRWWTAPGTMADAIAYYGAHPPGGTKKDGSSTAAGPGGTTAEGVSFGPSGGRWLRPTVYTELELLVSVAPTAHGVAIRVDADAIWLPQRTPAEHIPGDVTSVHVVVDRNGHPVTVRRTLRAAEARSLATVVNGLPVSTPGEFSCPADFGGQDRLTFHGARGDVQVDADTSGCAGVTVGRQSEHNPPLSGGRTLDHAVLRALGLPANYGGS